MTIGRERVNIEMRMANYYDTLKRLSDELTKGSLEAFAELKTLLAPDENDGVREDEITLKDLAELNTPQEVLGALWGATTLIEDLWDNFGEGNLGFSPDSISLVKDIARGFGYLIRDGVIEHQQVANRPMWRLGDLVGLYEKLVKETELKAQTSDGRIWPVL